MATPVEVVEAFFADFNQGTEGMYDAIRAYFTPQAVWDNVGLATTTGVEEAVALVSQFHEEMKIASVVVEMLAIAADGNKVFTERIDRLYDDAGAELSAPLVVGVLVIEEGKISEWRDYFDPRAAAELTEGA
ncbi:limonene-1,2-epoxide hydrolase [Mangrovimicrobium sediminis]|uniref:Limonene-1,2-epoxide hydrolase n=1 Tax=Mangrovimicrobium sediminis TaxID=2562682 RepID=A0A4Z0LSU5_9GAMM|nr:limonene-1,2-epoxide hydrolase family protein [Haliea sp. SAOS-164]TGD70370.1 limonene-1,2-epoxide hydrolase [Haliea sp. SAOS-164]